MFQEPGGQNEWADVLAEQLSRHGKLYYRLAFGILRNAAAAEDVCQQALLKAWQRREELREAAAIRAWLARVVLNESLQARRRMKTEQRVLGVRAAAVEEAGSSGVNGFDLKEAVLLAMEKLPENTRVIVAMRLMQNLSGNETKELLGCSAAEVSRQLHRGLELLGQSLADWQHA